MVWQYSLLCCHGRDKKSDRLLAKTPHNQRKAFFLWVCCFLAKNYLILHPSFENLTTNIALNRICKFHILGSMPSDEWFRLVAIALDKFSLKIVNHKSRLQFCTINAGKGFLCGCLTSYYRYFYRLSSTNSKWSLKLYISCWHLSK